MHMPLDFAPGRIYNIPDLLLEFWRGEKSSLSRIHLTANNVSQRNILPDYHFNEFHPPLPFFNSYWDLPLTKSLVPTRLAKIKRGNDADAYVFTLGQMGY